MGLQYHVQVMLTHEVVRGYSGDFLREHYGCLPFLTGKSVEKVSEEGWSQLVGYSTAKEFMRRFGTNPGDWNDWRGGMAGEMYRITIA